MIGAGFLRATRFALQIEDNRFHSVDSQVVDYTPPGVRQEAVTQPSPLRDIPWPGTKIDYDDLAVSVLYNKDASNFREIFNWIKRNRHETETHDITMIGYDNSGIIVYKMRFLEAFPDSLSSDGFSAGDANDSPLKFSVNFKFVDMVMDGAVG